MPRRVLSRDVIGGEEARLRRVERAEIDSRLLAASVIDEMPPVWQEVGPVTFRWLD